MEDGTAEPDSVSKTILAGFSDQVARRLDSGTLRCELVHNRRGLLARESVARDASLIVAAEVREIEARQQDPSTLITLATAISEAWLQELFPGDFRTDELVVWDSIQRKVLCQRQRRFRDLVLETGGSGNPSPDLAAKMLADRVMEGSCPLSNWNNDVDQWILRVNNAATWFPEAEISPIGDGERRMLVEQICYGATSYKEIKERPVWPTIKSWLPSPMQQFVETNAPERLDLPNGKRAKITYHESGQPVVACRIQDLYGVTESLRIAQNRVPLLIQVLAPNYRPVQITSNLATFWKEAYPKLKQELQRKYPKHEWR